VKPPIICLVTDGRMDVSGCRLDLITAAAHAGVDLIQIREPVLDDRALLALVRGSIDAAAGTPARIVVNDRLDIALAAGAAGVHLRSTSISPICARALAPEGFLIGRSVHSVAESEQTWRQGGCDYLVFGTVFPSRSKPAGHRVVGLEALRAVCAAVPMPVLAIGGVTLETAGLAARAGATGVAAIGIFAETGNLTEIVKNLRQTFDT
jgi:thiamine-phosphate diphosphorylase